MPRTCSICKNGDRESIDAELALNVPFRTIALRLGISAPSVKRHADNHLRPSLARALASREDLSAQSIIDEMASLAARSLDALDRATKEKARPSDFARLMREHRENWLAIARLCGHLRDGHGSNVFDNRRTQINIALAAMTEPELRRLAALAPAKDEH